MELALARNGKGCQFLWILIQLHLPESGSEVQCGRIISPDVADAFGDLLHGVFVNVGVLVELPEVLNDPEPLAVFLWNTENGWVIEWVWSLNNPQFQPFIQCLFDELVRGVPGMIPGHLVQTPGCSQHWQIWLGLGQGFQTQDSSQNAGSSLPEAVQNPGGTPAIHQTNPGWMVEIGGH